MGNVSTNTSSFQHFTCHFCRAKNFRIYWCGTEVSRPNHFFISASLHEFNSTWQPVTSSNVGVDSSKLIRRVGRSSSLQHMMCSNLFWVKTEHKIMLPDVRCYFHEGYDSTKANNLKQHLYFRPQVGIEVSPMLRETDRFAMH